MAKYKELDPLFNLIGFDTAFTEKIMALENAIYDNELTVKLDEETPIYNSIFKGLVKLSFKLISNKNNNQIGLIFGYDIVKSQYHYYVEFNNSSVSFTDDKYHEFLISVSNLLGYEGK